VCGCMVDIKSPTVEIRRGKRKKKKPQGKNIMSASAMQGGHNKWSKDFDEWPHRRGRMGNNNNINNNSNSAMKSYKIRNQTS